MEKIATRLFPIQLLAVGLAIAFAVMGWQQLLLGYAGLGLLAIGIPHGAADVLHRHATPFPKLPMFIGVYIAIMTVYALLWWGLPSVGLLIFAVISAFHFGQTFTESSLWYHPITLFVGALFLVLPVYFHPNEAFEIFSTMIGTGLQSNTHVLNGLLVFLLLGLSISLYKLASKGMSSKIIVTLVLTAFLLAWAPLIEGFLLAFIIWHAVPSTLQQWYFFQQQKAGPVSTFTTTILVYTGFAGVFLAVAWLLLPVTVALLFILLSIITLPHALVIHKTMDN